MLSAGSAISGLLAALLLIAGAGCDTPSQLISVDLLTDLLPGEEFTHIELSLYAGDTRALLGAPERIASPIVVDAETDTRTPLRLGEFADLSSGSWLVYVVLKNRGREVDFGLVELEVGGESTNVTIRITRSCANVQCPDGEDQSLSTCLGGQCVDPRCSRENPQFCPVSECASDTECAVPEGEHPCAEGICLAGVCGIWRNSQRELRGQCCPEGEVLVGERCLSPASCAESPCFEGVSCTDDDSALGYSCAACPDGYEGDGSTCADIDSCAGSPCAADTECVDIPAPRIGFTCGTCGVGFVDVEGACADFDACAGDPCYERVTCTDEPPPSIDFACGQCPAGFIGDGVDCERAVVGACASDSCAVNVECIEDPTGAYHVCGPCPAGTTRSPGGRCYEINGCEGSPCAVDQICEDVAAPATGYTCAYCPEGSRLEDEECIPLPCETPHYCAEVGTVSAGNFFDIPVADSLGSSRVFPGQGLDTPSGAAIGYIATPSDTSEGPTESGLVHLSGAPTARGITTGVGTSTAPNRPAIAGTGNSLVFLDGDRGYQVLTPIALPEMTSGPERSFLIPASDGRGGTSPPALLSQPDGLLLSLGVDESGLASQLALTDVIFSDGGSQHVEFHSSRNQALTRTCNGILASSIGRYLEGLSAAAFVEVRRRGFLEDSLYPDLSSESELQWTSTVFDGQQVITTIIEGWSNAGTVVRIDADARNSSNTLVRDALAAVAIDAGLLVLVSSADPGVDERPAILLVNPDTGETISTLAVLPAFPTASTEPGLRDASGSVVIDTDPDGGLASIFFVTSSAATPSRLLGVRLDCTP